MTHACVLSRHLATSPAPQVGQLGFKPPMRGPLLSLSPVATSPADPDWVDRKDPDHLPRYTPDKGKDVAFDPASATVVATGGGKAEGRGPSASTTAALGEGHLMG
jgi:hypothetical protein